MVKSLDNVIEKTVGIYLSTAHAACIQGNSKLAKKLYRRAVTLVRKTVDGNNYLISILVGLSSVYLAERRPRKSEQLLLRAQELMKTSNNENSELYCEINLSLAECYAMQQRFGLSKMCVQNVLARCKQKMTVNKSHLAYRLTAVGRAYFQNDELDSASELIRELIQLQNQLSSH